MAYNRTLNHFTSMQELASIWASSVTYATNQVVINNDILYRCLVDHVSTGSFATDLAGGNWTQLSSNTALNVITATSGVTLLASSNQVILADATSGNVQLNLNDLTSIVGKLIYVKKIDSSSNLVIMYISSGASVFDGADSFRLEGQYDAVQLISDGTNWRVF